jgi:hypothetical protein
MVVGRTGGSSTRPPSRFTVSRTGAPRAAWIRSEMPLPLTASRFTATISSPACKPARAAGELSSTAATSLVAAVGMPSMKITASRPIAKTRLVAGPARIVATRFHVCCRQYASGPRPSRISASPRSAPRRAGGLSSASATAASRRGNVARAASMSPCSSSSFSAVAGGPSSERSAIARPKCASTSDGAGRCIPGIFTKPPSGIAPIPYSMPLRRTFTRAGGKPT